MFSVVIVNVVVPSVVLAFALIPLNFQVLNFLINFYRNLKGVMFEQNFTW